MKQSGVCRRHHASCNRKQPSGHALSPVLLLTDLLQEAAAATEPLTSALWGDHRLAVLLPPGTRVPPPPSFSGGPGTSLPAMGPDDVGSLVQDGDDARNSTAQELAGASPFAGV